MTLTRERARSYCAEVAGRRPVLLPLFTCDGIAGMGEALPGQTRRFDRRVEG